ncbi:MAG: type IV secretory system conjugative DNA transfer family protein [Alphaproteobacteria bacterium]|nr:type IV secretory system conjugative DNA transfer family protein [Alphaproteobacteria bacterium]
MAAVPSYAQEAGDEYEIVPQGLKDLQALEPENGSVFGEGEFVPWDIRRDAIKEAAISYGARGGLAWQTYYIRRDLETRARYLDKVFDFGQLLIPAPSGLMIEPPIVSESANAMLIEYGAQEAAVSDRVYNIIRTAQIVSAPRNWRDYLERSWGVGEVEPPPDILRPQNDEERALWVAMVEKGWKSGVVQANEIFEDDLTLLSADFRGMIRYRMLLAQGMISPPRALQIDRGITGGGQEMRVGDRAVQITGAPELMPAGAETWKPANR